MKTKTVKHTPGPWKINDSVRETYLKLCELEKKEPSEWDGWMRGNDGSWYVGSENGGIAEVRFKGENKKGSKHTSPDIEGFSNARLVAAAPDLLKFAKVIMETFALRSDLEKMGSEAIAKAEGNE